VNESGLGREGYPVGSIIVSECQHERRDDTDICDTGDSDALEFAAIQLFYCGFEVRSSFELDEASDSVSDELFEVLKETLTLYRPGHDRSRSKQRQGWIDERNL
jgi:hypothetical protein